MRVTEARSLLFLPATSPHLLAKATQRGADALIVDLEDSVPLERKAEARGMAVVAIAQLAGRSPLLVRVNAAPDLLHADIEALPLAQIDGVLLPKVESATQVQDVASRLAARQAPGDKPVAIAVLIESALGVVRAESIATAHASICALGFGSEDYAADTGLQPQPQSLLWPAQAVATVARAFGLASWGLPGSVADIEDMDAFGRLVALARDIGFTGTVCIHPRQVPVANAGFGPTEQERAWALRVLAADEEARARGLGAVTFDGRMIDRPIVERARRTLIHSRSGD